MIIDLENELMVTRGEGSGEGTAWEFGMDTDTLLCLKWITNKDLPYSTWNSAQCYVAAWMGGEFGGEWIHAYLTAESLACAPEAITTLSVNRLYPKRKQTNKKF